MKRLVFLLLLLLAPAAAQGQVVWDDMPWVPITYGSWGEHWSGGGANGYFGVPSGVIPTEWRIALKGFQQSAAGTDGTFAIDGENRLMDVGCNSVAVEFYVQMKYAPGGGAFETRTGVVSVQIGRNGYGRVYPLSTANQAGTNWAFPDRVPVNVFSSWVDCGSWVNVGAGYGDLYELGEVTLNPDWYDDVILLLADSVGTRSDFTAFIPRCPSGVFDNGSSGDGGSGGGDPPEEEPEETDTDGDGVPDYADFDPEDEDITNVFDWAAWRDYLKGYIPSWSFDFDPLDLDEAAITGEFTFDIPGVGPSTFFVSTLFDVGTPLGAALDGIRLLARGFMLVFLVWGVAEWIIRDCQEAVNR